MRLLLFSFSPRGKTALLTLVLQQLVRNFSKLSITVVTSKNCGYFFYNVPGVHVVTADLGRNYRYFWGLYRLYRELWQLGPYNRGLDFQCSLHTYLLRFYFLFSGLDFVSARRAGVAGKLSETLLNRHKVNEGFALFNWLGHYFTTFARIGLLVSTRKKTSSGSWISLDIRSRAVAHRFLEKQRQRKHKKRWVALIPFGNSKNSRWSVPQVHDLVLKLERKFKVGILLFAKDRRQNLALRQWYNQTPQAVVLCPVRWNLGVDMAVMKRMQFIVSMDENYMCLAALLGVRMIYIEKPPIPAASGRYKHQFWFHRHLSRLAHNSIEEIVETMGELWH